MRFPISQQAWRKFLTGFLIFLAVSVGWSTVYRAAWNNVERTDYTVYLAAGKAVLDNTDIYDAHNARGWNYVYPPTFAVICAPLATMSRTLGSTLWFLLEAFCLWISCRMSIKLVTERYPDAAGSLLLPSAPLLGLSVLLISSTTRCQASGFVVAMILGAFYLNQRGRSFWGGLSLAAAIVIKLFPATLLAYFALRRQWKFLFGAAAGLVIFGLLVPAAWWGFAKTGAYWLEWIDRVGHPAVMDNHARQHAVQLYDQLLDAAKPRNQSLEALFLSLGAGSALGQKLAMLVGALLLAVIGWRTRNAPPRDELWVISAFLIWHLLVPPISETHYFGTLILPLCLAAAWLVVRRQQAPARTPYGIYILMIAPFTINLLLVNDTASLFRPLCLACLFGLWWVLTRIGQDGGANGEAGASAASVKTA